MMKQRFLEPIALTEETLTVGQNEKFSRHLAKKTKLTTLN